MKHRTDLQQRKAAQLSCSTACTCTGLVVRTLLLLLLFRTGHWQLQASASCLQASSPTC